jgi:hypothetical protein
MADSTTTSRERYFELVRVILQSDAAPEIDLRPEQIERLLRLLLSEDDQTANDKLATWLRDAL